ncbi:hypothetical protein AMTR_s00055p00127960 [Amborella trichopoda]|uniref:Uncharacterized protein n=1 Tax=Amborella trichopoda TaxID=13333 RepID=U5D723_AMBTC|nr:hypothetical protein AMTR_s00055p00127960 [Amborella trichopoda]
MAAYLDIEAPTSGKVVVDVQISLPLSPAAPIWGHKHCFALALNLVLLSVANMYPLSHCRAARKLHSSPKPGFDPLIVDPLALVVLEEGDV